MATRTLTKTAINEPLLRGAARLFSWTGLTNATTDDGEPIGTDYAGYSDRSVQVIGTFGVGGTVRIEGSLDGTNYAVLTDPQGNALDITSAKIEAISEAVLYMRPRVTGGDGTTSLSVYIFGRQERL